MRRIEIYKLEFSDCFDYLIVNMIVPSFILFRRFADEYDGKTYECDIEFSNKLFFTIDDNWFKFEFVILGFGIGIVRQWDY